jgi:hypothetical protein
MRPIRNRADPATVYGVSSIRVRRWIMGEYRAYIVGEDGHICRTIALFCPDDETAKTYAKNLVVGHDIELWQRDRKIEYFQHDL